MHRDNNLPKVLVIDVNAWRKDAGANTLRDIFSCWDPEKLAVVYTSSQLPDSEVCNHYFQISENQIIKSLYHPTLRVGRPVDKTPSNNDADAMAERERYAKAHKHHAKWMRLAREVVWKFGHWKSKALKQFVMDFKPDIIFVPIFPYAYMGRIQKYIIKLTGKPTVCYLADDNYSYDSCMDCIDYIHRFWTRQYVGPLARTCNQVFVIVDKEKEDTDSRFRTDSVILTKSIDFTGRSYQYRAPHKPIRFIYTGGLIIGRDKTLALVADAINKINAEKGDVVAELFIYSQHQPTVEINNHINVGESHYCGSVPHQEIKGIQQQADVVVFAEGLEGKEANIAKLSFSTKITDYLANGKCVLAIGKDYIAPIDYFRRNDSALIAHNAEEIEPQIRRIVSSPELISEYSRKAYDCAFKNHNREMMDKRFIETMCKAIK
ncbi:glycosyltransferase [Bacteroides ovatus]|uniref:glycosyltransferase n=1 Tax=Bacteroides ovatus TaxID=28116 RepID=UPI0018C91609|nr:glycosyltransferase [Bacteroides ovatus]MBG9220336.1 glycosyltransferase [Bacteroides ovatus]MBG9233466.1 glycosyltransferase [Bacteroides ovatus]